jgi:homoserine dehydrogenase
MPSATPHRMLLAGVLGLGLVGRGWAQVAPEAKEPKKDPHAAHGAADKMMAEKSKATLKAELVDPQKKAKQQAATVKVDVSGVEIIDPATVNEMAKAGQGHLHYTVDAGPTIATTTKKLSFHGLTPGKHTIKIVLAGNDHAPLGPEQTVDVDIP